MLSLDLSYQTTNTLATPYTSLLIQKPIFHSMRFLPEGYRELVNAADSPIRDFYPNHYHIDPNGQAQDWKACRLCHCGDGFQKKEVAAREGTGPSV